MNIFGTRENLESKSHLLTIMTTDISKLSNDKWLVTEVEEGFFHVQYNNPRTLNAYCEEDWREYQNILTTLDSDPSTKVIFISSAFAKAFSSGLNLKAATEVMKGKEEWSYASKRNFMFQHIREFQDAISVPARMRTPTIALLNGVCYGLALDIAAACSIRIATQDVKMSIREIKIGIVADIGSLQRMTNIVGNKSLMNQYALTGKIFGAQEAMNIGFISDIVQSFEEGLEYGRELGLSIAENPSWAIKGTKESIQFMADGGSVEQGLHNIAKYNSHYLVGGFPDEGPKL